MRSFLMHLQKEYSMSLKQIGDMLKVTPSTVQRYLKGTAYPSPVMLSFLRGLELAESRCSRSTYVRSLNSIVKYGWRTHISVAMEHYVVHG